MHERTLNLPEFHNFIKFHHQTVVYDPNHYFRYWNWNPNWPILLADSVTDTETTSQRENLVTDSVGHSFNHKHWIFESMIWRLFLKIWVYFPAHKNLYPPKKWKNIVSVSEKKVRLRNRYWKWTLVSVPDTKIWFRSCTKLNT